MDLLLQNIEESLAIITINRPDKANAFNIDILKDFNAKLMDADNNEKVKCILIRSTRNRFFSASYDLKEITGDPVKIAQITEWGRKVNEGIIMIKNP